MTSRNTESRIQEALETDPPLNPSQQMESMPHFLDYITTARPREEGEVTDPLPGPAGAGSPQAMMTGGTGDGEKNPHIGKTIVTED